MQLNRCRRRSPHGERGNLPIATSTCKVPWLRHMQVECGVQWKQKICVTAAAQSLQYVQYVQSTVLCTHVCTDIKHTQSPQWILIGNSHRWMFVSLQFEEWQWCQLNNGGYARDLKQGMFHGTRYLYCTLYEYLIIIQCIAQLNSGNSQLLEIEHGKGKKVKMLKKEKKKKQTENLNFLTSHGLRSPIHATVLSFY